MNTNHINSSFPDCPEFCTSLYDPVCGSNGVTYGNECEMNKATCNEETEVTVAFKGRCADGPGKLNKPWNNNQVQPENDEEKR